LQPCSSPRLLLPSLSVHFSPCCVRGTYRLFPGVQRMRAKWERV
jgi:hypothetical protein